MEHLDTLINVLDSAWQGGFTTRSTLVREHAEVVAMATERNLITTRVGPNLFGVVHLITPKGLTTLWSLKGIIE